MKNTQTALLTDIVGCQSAGVDVLAGLHGNVGKLFTDSVLQNIELPVAWSVDVPELGEEGYLPTCCVLTPASGIRVIFGFGGSDAPYWTLGVLFNAGQSVAWVFVSEDMESASVSSLEREIQRLDEYIHAGYTDADRLAAVLRFTGVAV